MSASLVGSEMCIRDSTHCGPARRWASRPTGQAPEGGARKTRRNARERGACLLYTSDAADDM
eukprot:11092443-Alexandrium_andersonii.AAC.1